MHRSESEEAQRSWLDMLGAGEGQVNESDGVGTVARGLLLKNRDYTHRPSDRGVLSVNA